MTQERCNALLGAVFGGFAMFGGAKWILSATERDVLAGTLAETLEAAPDSLVAGVSKMSAPVALLGELGLVIGKRLAQPAAAPQGAHSAANGRVPAQPTAPPPAPAQTPRSAADGPVVLIPQAAVDVGARMDDGRPNGLSPYS